MPRILFILQSAFSLWMLVDAALRRASYYWYPIILLPFGEWVYFFQVKINDPELRWLKNALSAPFRRRVTVDELRYRLRQTYCFANLLNLARALHDQGDLVEAERLFREAIGMNGDSLEARYGLALCQAGAARLDDAVDELRRIAEEKPSYDDYGVWFHLAEALWSGGQAGPAVETMTELVAISPRMNHRLMLAQYLERSGKYGEGQQQLAIALEEYEHSPPFQKRQDRQWARMARKMKRELEMLGDSPEG
jgi:hypothetical protein